jgi:hypothetical protein
MPSNGRSLLVCLALSISFALAGCVDGTGTPEAAPPEAAAGVPVVKDPAGNALARYDLAKPVAQTVWANGTYKAEEAFFPLGLAPAMLGLPPNGLRVADVSEFVPRNVPVRIITEVHAQVTDGDVDLWLNVPFNEVWAGTWDTPRGGYSKIETRMVHASDDPILVVLGYDELDRSTEFSYTLRIDILSEPERLVDAVGASLDVPVANATLLVNLERAGDQPALLAWGPDGKALGRVDVKQGVNEVKLAEKGEHLLLLTEGTGDATLALQGVSESPRLRPAEQEIVEFMSDTSQSSAAWSFEADRAPLQVGFFASSATVASGFSGSLTSPAGTLIESRASDTLPWVRPFAGFGIGEWTTMGAEGLVKGKYDFTVSFETSAGPDPIHYGHFIVFIAPPK